MKIVELLIDELDNLSGVEAVALVESPAIEADFYAFNQEVNVEDFIVEEIIKKELFVERLPGESRESYMQRCIPKLRDEGYGEDQAIAICYQGLSEVFDETEDPQELIIGSYQTRHWDMCPGATALYERILNGEFGVKDLALLERSAKLQDALFYLEKHTVKEMQSATIEDVISAQNLADEIYILADMLNLREEHGYIEGHVNAIKELANVEFESYTDYPQSATNAAKRALEWRDGHPDQSCGTRVGWARANQLAKREPISEDTIARMASFARHLQHEDVPYSEGCGGLMVDAWGGRAGIEWAQRKLDEIRTEASAFSFALEEDQQMVVGPLMIPDKLILRMDENNDPYYVFFSTDTVKKIAEKLMKNKFLDNLNLEHNPEQPVKGHMVSTWIIEDKQKDKQNVYGFDLPVGTWMGQYKIEDSEAWDMVKEGMIKGFSVEGFFQDKFIQASKNI